jgi:hypothetical protein
VSKGELRIGPILLRLLALALVGMILAVGHFVPLPGFSAYQRIAPAGVRATFSLAGAGALPLAAAWGIHALTAVLIGDRDWNPERAWKRRWLEVGALALLLSSIHGLFVAQWALTQALNAGVSAPPIALLVGAHMASCVLHFGIALTLGELRLGDGFALLYSLEGVVILALLGGGGLLGIGIGFLVAGGVSVGMDRQLRFAYEDSSGSTRTTLLPGLPCGWLPVGMAAGLASVPVSLLSGLAPATSPVVQFVLWLGLYSLALPFSCFFFASLLWSPSEVGAGAREIGSGRDAREAFEALLNRRTLWVAAIVTPVGLLLYGLEGVGIAGGAALALAAPIASLVIDVRSDLRAPAHEVVVARPSRLAVATTTLAALHAAGIESRISGWGWFQLVGVFGPRTRPGVRVAQRDAQRAAQILSQRSEEPRDPGD